MKKLFLLFTLVPAIIFASDFPRSKGPVIDFARVIDPSSREQLENLLTQLENQTGIAMVIATLPSLKGSDIESLTANLYQEWGIGKKGEDKGLLILAAIEDRTARIEVGYGLESVIPDALAGRILRETLFPYFRKEQYGEGFLETSATIIKHLQKNLGFELNEALPRLASKSDSSLIEKLIALLFILVVFYFSIRHPFWFLFLLGGGGRRFGGGFGGSFGGGFRGGGLGGGFGGCGGGLSGGGGASGRW